MATLIYLLIAILIIWLLIYLIDLIAPMGARLKTIILVVAVLIACFGLWGESITANLYTNRFNPYSLSTVSLLVNLF